MELNFSIGNASSPLSEVANVLDSFGWAMMWLFFIVSAIVVAIIYIKKKNADSDRNKHS